MAGFGWPPRIMDACEAPVEPEPQTLTRSAPPIAGYRKFDVDDHGTAVAGLIAARKTDFGGSGLAAPEVTIVPIHSGEPGLTRDLRDAVAQYNVRVFNLSFAFRPNESFDELHDVIAGANGRRKLLFVVSAPDDGKPVNVRVPIMYGTFPNVVGVAATVPNGQSLLPDNGGNMWGAQYVQIAAPGIGYGSLGRKGGYVPVGGTSFAAPLVAATAALLVEQGLDDPTLVKNRLIATATVVPSYRDKIQGGLLNVQRAVTNLGASVLVEQIGQDARHDKVVNVTGNPTIQFMSSAKGSIPVLLRDILRLTLIGNRYRLVFNDRVNGSVRIVDDVEAIKKDQITYRSVPTVRGGPPGSNVLDHLGSYADYFGPINNN